MVTIFISAEAYRAIAGREPDPERRDRAGGFPLVVDHKMLARLKGFRGPGESYSDVILRLAEIERREA